MAMAVGAASERKAKLWELALRCLICLLGTLAAALVATDSQTRTFFSLEKKARYTDMKALVLLVAANGAAAAYSLLQAFRCAVSIARDGSGSSSSKVVAWSVFSGDQLLAYATLAATAAAAQASAIGKKGQPELQWMGICDLYGAFCRQVGGGIACAVGAGLAAVVLAPVSAFNLFRLYGGGGGKGYGGDARNGGATW